MFYPTQMHDVYLHIHLSQILMVLPRSQVKQV